MLKRLLFTIISIFLLGYSTSSSAKETSLDAKIKAEKEANTPEEIAQRAADVFSSAPGLTPDQRKKLNKLYLKTYSESRQITKEIGQMKSLLFKEAAIKKFKSNEVNELTRKIMDADQRRMNLMFSALEEMQNIVGYGQDKKDLYEYLRNYDIPKTEQR